VSSLVGRESELEAVETFLRSERPCAVAIVGEPGIGKTTLWQAAVDHARAQGARVLVARPTESEARLAFAGLADLLADVPDELFARLPEPQRVGLDAALLRAPSARPPERRVVGAGFLTLLRALAGESEVVCAIDDLHWLDASSAAVIEFALRRLGEEPVRGLVSVRATELGRAPMPALERALEVEHLELGALSVAALHRVLAQELGRTFPRPTLVRITQAAGGNPLYAIEIARELDRRGEHDLSGRVPVPQGLDALVRARVRALPAVTRDALLRAAALARPDTETIDPVELVPAEEAGLVRVEVDGRIEFVHPLFAMNVARNRWQRVATLLACFRGLRVPSICGWLLLVATTGLHKGSIVCRQLVRRTGRDEAGLVSVDHALDAVAQVELLEDAGDVRLRRCFANDELFADLRVRHPAREQAEYFLLAGCQLGDGRRRRARGDRLLSCELLDHGAGDSGGEQRLAAGDDADGSGDLFGRRVLEHEAARARAQRVVHVGVEAEGGQDQHARARLRRHDQSGRLDPVQDGHADVHQHDVGAQAAGFGDRVLAVAGLTDDARLWLRLEDLAEPDADERLVVGDQDARHRIGSRTRTAKPPLGRRPASRRPP